MTEATPGPWYAVANGGDDPDERKLLVGANDEWGDFTMLADCRSSFVGSEIEGDSEANARLIAAAPDLLAALKRIEHDWDGEPEDMQEAREAINRAEGKP